MTTEETRKQIAEAVTKEREACAKIADKSFKENGYYGKAIAAAIRSRK